MSTKKKIFILVLGIEALAIAGLIVFLFYLNSDTVKVSRQLELAQHYLLEEDYEQAIAAYEIAIQIDPKNTEAYLGLAKVYEEQNDLEKAVEILEEASKKVASEEVTEMLAQHKIELAQIKQKEADAQAMDETASQQEVIDIPQSESIVEETAVPQSETETIITGFVTQDENIYYYDAEGNLVTGWFDVNEHRYCARNDGSLYKDGEHEIDNVNYLFGQDGICFGEIKDENWKQAYYDYIVNEASYQNGAYALCFVDDNDIPEIYIRKDVNVIETAGYGCLITYKDSAVYTYNQYGNFAYIPRSGLSYTYGIRNGVNGFIDHDRNGIYDSEIVRLSDAVWQQVAELEDGVVCHYPSDSSDNSWVEYEYYYIFNGQQVTEEQYSENKNRLFNFDQAVWWWWEDSYEGIGYSQMQTMDLSSILVYLQN